MENKKKIIIVFLSLIFLYSKPVLGQEIFSVGPVISDQAIIEDSFVENSLDLTTREKSPNINQGFADNILLAVHYLNGEKFTRNKVDWEKIREPFTVSFTLKPGESFAFHNNVLEGMGEPAVSTNSKFETDEGYKSVAGLGGNGVCHLASLINWTSQEAGLEVVAPVNHNFYPIAGVPKEFGTSIYSSSPEQNLYIRNNQINPVTFIFESDSTKIDLRIIVKSVLL